MRIALTFDDGPSQWTVPILDLLEQHEAKATFFVCGWAVQKHAFLLRRMVEEGHEVGNHTYKHLRLTDETDDQVENQLRLTSELIESITGEPPTLWRAPYFATDARVTGIANSLGLRHIGATLDPVDWATSDPLVLVDRLAVCDDGEIVDLHDGVPPDGGTGTKTRQPTVDALAQFLHFDADFVTVTDLAARAVR